MDLLRSEEVDLVICSPPYFSAETEQKLKQPLREQVFQSDVSKELEKFARSLQPIFGEIGRVLKPGGVVALQTKDIRYGSVLIRLSDIHRGMVEDLGLKLVNRVYWRKIRTNRLAALFRKNPIVGAHRSDEVEDIFFFSKGAIPLKPRAPVELDPKEIASCSDAVWTLPSAGSRRTHPHQSPKCLVRRIVALYSRPGELVADPFLGHGTTIEVAVEMGRDAVGYEIDPGRAASAETRLQDLFLESTATNIHARRKECLP
jgi:DNA modification methylase